MRRTLTRRTVATAAAALTLTVVGTAASTGTAQAVTMLGGTASSLASSADTSYSNPLLYGFTKPSGMNATQGLGFKNGVFYVTSDEGGGKSRMIGLSYSGKRVFDSGSISGGHAQAVDVVGDLAYITATGLSTTAIKAYSLSQRKFVRTYPLPKLNAGAVAAIDRDNNRIVVVRGGAGRPHYLTTISLSSGAVTRTVPISVAYETQGLTVANGKVMVLTTYDGPTNDPHGRTNWVTTYTMDGKQTKKVKLPVREETEGITVDRGTGRVFVGAHRGDRILELKP